MTAGALAGSVLCGGVFTASGLVVAVTSKRAFFSTWRSSLAVVAVVLIWICWALGLGQLLGAFGLLRRGALLAAAVATAGLAIALSSRLRARPPPPGTPAADADPPRAGRAWLVTATALLVGVVAALWVARTVIAVHRGINDPDSLGYHLAFATSFAQSGFADQHRFVLPALPVHFYPANDELLSAIALALTRSVAFAAIKNLVFGAFVLVAAHALGRAFRAGVESVAAAAIVLGLPVIAFSQPGEATNDMLVLVALLGGLACLAHARDRPAPYLLAMACAGVALGDKFSAVVPAAGLAILAAVLLVVRVPAHRARWASIGAAAGAALGGSWYLRNAITYGNPIPPAHLALGPLHLAQIATPEGPKSFSILGFLVRGRSLGVFARNLPKGLGPLAVVVAGLCIYGTVAALASGDHFRRGLGVFSLICLIGYLATPASAYGMGQGGPGAFVINLHYAAPAVLIAMVSAAIALAGWRRAWLLAVVGLVVVATGVDAGRRIAFWSPEIGGLGLLVLLVATLTAAAAAWAWTRPGRRPWAMAGAAATAVVVAVGAVMVARHYPSLPSTDPVERWAASVPGVRIAAWVPDIAWLYGPGSRNRVVTLTRLADHAPVALDSCPAWMQAVVQGHFPYSAVIPGTVWYRWLTSDPAFQLVAQNDLAAVFRVVGRPDIGCSLSR